jgi:hypothetical protein
MCRSHPTRPGLLSFDLINDKRRHLDNLAHEGKQHILLLTLFQEHLQPIYKTSRVMLHAGCRGRRLIDDQASQVARPKCCLH